MRRSRFLTPATRQQGPRDDGPDARDTLQQLVMFPPDRAGVNRGGQVLIELGEMLLEPVDVLLNLASHHTRGTAPAIFLRREHLDQLAAPRDQRRHCCVLASGRGRPRAAPLRQTGPRAAHRGASVLAKRPVARAKSRTWRGFTTATGKPAVASAPLSRTAKPPVLPGQSPRAPASAIAAPPWPCPFHHADRKRNPGRTQRHVQAGLRDIDPDKDCCCPSSESSSLLVARPCAMRARRPRRLCGLSDDGDVTTRAAARSQRT